MLTSAFTNQEVVTSTKLPRRYASTFKRMDQEKICIGKSMVDAMIKDPRSNTLQGNLIEHIRLIMY